MKTSPPRLLTCLSWLIGSLLACHPDLDPWAQVQTISLRASVNFLNADSTSQLPLTLTLLDKAGNPINYPDSAVQLYANGVRQTALQLRNRPYSPHAFYATKQAGPVSLQARWGALTSEPLRLTARPKQTYPVVKLPVVFHVPKSLDLPQAGISLAQLIAGVNQLYRDQGANPDPNHADSFIEFYLAPTDPAGQDLGQPGLNPVDYDDPPTNQAAGAKADSILARWCIKHYVNVFVGLSWDKSVSRAGISFSYTPPYPTEPYPGDLSCEGLHYRAAIVLANQKALVAATVAHELGHMLGLGHAFGSCQWSTDEHVKDLPAQEEAHPDGVNQKRACNQVPFWATNVMDYYNRRLGFTHDQVAVMRVIVTHPTYLPIQAGSLTGGRSVRLGRPRPVERVRGY